MSVYLHSECRSVVSARCVGCGAELDDPVGPRQPCVFCGSLARHLSVLLPGDRVLAQVAHEPRDPLGAGKHAEGEVVEGGQRTVDVPR